jgi:hypothetical protein
MKRSDAEPWISFLLSLKGTYGTFLMGDPNAVQPQGPVVKRNTLEYSEDFTNAYWSKSMVTATPTAFTNPETNLPSGVHDIVETTGTGVHSIVRSRSIVANTRYTLWYDINSASTREVVINFAAAGFTAQQQIKFNASTQALTVTQGSPSFGYVSLGSGWYRVYMSAVATSTATSSLGLFLYNGATSYTGDGVSFVRVTAAQLEEDSTEPTPYQKVIGSFGDTPLVNGGSQSGETLLIKSLNQSVVGIIKAGDYIQLGTGSGTRLHKVLSDVTSDSSGNASVDIWPSLRESPPNNSIVYVVGTVGRFRLSQNIQMWEINNISSYGMTFDCIEAL